jgi:Ni/Fe-hydrogenase subunit HybB-like protein
MILFVIYNVIILPINLGFEYQMSNFQMYLDYFIDVFFACDIVLNFFTGYYDEKKNLIMNHKMIIKNYLKLWFWIDILATMPFEIVLGIIGESENDHVKLFALLKTPRLIRIGRILKFLEHI